MNSAASRKPELEAFLKENRFAYQVIPNVSMLIITKFETPDKKGEINAHFPMNCVIDREVTAFCFFSSYVTATIPFVPSTLTTTIK